MKNKGGRPKLCTDTVYVNIGGQIAMTPDQARLFSNHCKRFKNKTEAIRQMINDLWLRESVKELAL
jgi:hypothetical protein